MFGFSFSELLVLIVVGLVVIGPKELPRVLRKVGHWAGKLRRMAGDLRAQSGIDDVLRNEGLTESLGEIRKLARGEIESVRREVTGAGALATVSDSPSIYDRAGPMPEITVSVDREYPRDGADSYGTLPDTAIVYDGSLPFSALERDPLYMLGDASAVVPDRVAEKLETEADIPHASGPTLAVPEEESTDEAPPLAQEA